MTGFSNVWGGVLNFFAKIGSDVVDFITPLAEEIAKNGGVVLMNIALNAVLAAEKSGGTGADKFKAAKDTVIVELKAQGLPVVMNAVNGAIESAVAKMKADHKSAALPPPAEGGVND